MNLITLFHKPTNEENLTDQNDINKKKLMFNKYKYSFQIYKLF